MYVWCDEKAEINIRRGNNNLLAKQLLFSKNDLRSTSTIVQFQRATQIKYLRKIITCCDV